MNIMIPEGEDDYVSDRDKDSELILSMCAAVLTLTVFLVSFFLIQREFPVPEQFKTVWDGSKLVTEPTEIAG